jgi:reticulon-4-interacting protein 1, mitochondrial
MHIHQSTKRSVSQLQGGDLHVIQMEVPPLPANEVLVKVKAASINPVDIQSRKSGLLAVVSGDKEMGRHSRGP